MSELVDSLDAALAEAGEDIVLRRIVGTGNQAPIDVRVRARVDDVDPEELVAGSGSAQQRAKVIISPTQIIAAQWPGGVVPGYVGDPRVPVRGDKAVIRGKARNIEFAKPFVIGGELVRIELTVLG